MQVRSETDTVFGSNDVHVHSKVGQLCCKKKRTEGVCVGIAG